MISPSYQKCIEAAVECARACEECCAACISEGHSDTAMKTGDCAHICWTLSSFMGRNSEFSRSLAKTCEEICDACERACSQHRDSDHHIRCAAACHRAANACRELSSDGIAGHSRAKSTKRPEAGASLMT